ncbi:extracellular solute-binding protein [Akkermansia glycaniphila]|uniref:Bacterial extracellular solute-binding proteins family 5 middle n=1 Tax=Akkermansia glycaniphila TaxID=1679444 RepID=A0A1C7PCG3_9BACT|nr:extracellular solute-binding protein [Akkermansia glycaniphila]OCA03168.1 hypothetical protein AC781_06525 [Akkermansia glycaniphila]SEH95946.1 bacterial extracellular solute-binding proteins family 5 middle [Akkermansia glycaniphila]
MKHGFLSFCTLLFLLICLNGCGDSARARGVAWQPEPEEQDMPLGFPGKNTPDYAKKWRMPPGFAPTDKSPGFIASWNARCRSWLENAIKQQEETVASLERLKEQAQNPAEKRHHETTLKTARNQLAAYRTRLDGGPYIRLQRPEDLPAALPWESNWDEPELGDPRATKGGTLRLPITRSFPDTFRPFGPNSNNGFRRYLYDDIAMDLVTIHPGTGAIIPGLADKWAVSDDGRTVYYHIDDKATFTDGTPITTRDFLTAIYIRTSPYAKASYYQNYYLENIAGITLYGPRTFSVTLPARAPMPVYKAALTCDPTHFYSEFGADYAERYQWRTPPGTGGYAVSPDNVIRGTQIGLRRIPDWWAKNRKYARYSCNVDDILYLFYADPAKVRELFRIGELDVLSLREPEHWYEGMEIPEVHHGYIRRAEFHNIWPRSPFGFFLNTSRPPFNDKNIRLGLHHAMNIDGIIDTVFRGDYRRLHSYATGFGKYTNPSIRAREYSPEKAREYFAMAGYTRTDREGYLCTPGGKRLTVEISYANEPLYNIFMSKLREDAARCGVEILPDSLDTMVFFRKVMDKRHQAAVWSWGFTPPIPRLHQGFHSSFAYDSKGNVATTTNNITAYADDDLDEALIDERDATTEQEAVAASHRAQQLIHDSATWIPGWTTDFWRLAYWRWIQWPRSETTNFAPPRYYDPLDSHLYWIDENEKAATIRARHNGETYPEKQENIPLPPGQTP